MTTTAFERQDRPTGTEPLAIADEVVAVQTMFANLFLVGPRDRWVLVDAGMPMFANRVIRTAEQLYGPGAKPQAIILTHGHFDHVGSLQALVDHYDVPIYAHELELPYVTGRSSYPPPDPSVGGGMMARTSFLLPDGPFDFGDRVQPLPTDGTVPGLDGWRWVATPGHSPGHVSLWRESDRTLIAGDAFVTTRQESIVGALTQFKEMNGPPAYFTCDWDAARASVQRLAALEPEIAVTGHGLPMRGEELRQRLQVLAHNFDEIAVPKYGRYIHDPARTDVSGVTYVPPPVADSVKVAMIGGAVLGGLMLLLRRR